MTSDSTPAFNLLDEPWIPVQTHSGEGHEVSLTDALLNARDYTALAETSPPNLIALYRLLLAVLHRALTTQHGPWKDADRARWFRDGLPESPIRNYLEHWRDRFWLFHSTHPFMQVATLATLPETAETRFSCSILSLDQFYGPEMFDHRVYWQGPRNTVAVLRGFLGYLQFVPGGFFPGKKLKTSEKAGPLANSAAVLVIGANLEQTLLLNLHPYDARREDDRPIWEKDAPKADLLRASPTFATGTDDRYTHLSRSTLLERQDTPTQLDLIHFAAGISLADDPNAPDPMVAYRYSEKGEPIRVSFVEGRSIWRDLPALLADPEGQNAKPPAVLSNARNLYDALGLMDADISVLTAGLASDQAKLLRWRIDRIALPQAMLTNPEAAAELRAQVRFSDEVFFRLRGVYADMIALTMPDPRHKDTKARAREILVNGPAAAVFFSTAERALPKLMHQIAAGDIDAADRDWRATLVEAAKQSWEATRRSLGDSPAVLRADARTYPRFSGLLNSLVQSITESTAEEAAA
jgi:CRISPR system Cascade subunit CasA